MKKLFILFFIFFALFSLNSVQAQKVPGQWVWIHGTTTSDDLGNFGVQGVPSQSNEPPALYEAEEWKDRNGKFWFYGGLDDNTGIKIHDDLWMFDPVDSEWTWVNGYHLYDDHGVYGVQGVPSITNVPPGLGYGVATWTDLNGDLWMFGGWNDSSYADMWRYNIASNIWTWVNGPGVGNPPGVYGTQGVANAANYPPSRNECPATWVDGSGNLWLFGGYRSGIYNDLWMYNVLTNMWTWVKGSSVVSQQGSWGTMGVETSSNVPSARRAYCHWKDNAGNFWMFGGDGLDATGAFWQLSDLWRYNPVTNNWTWMNGQNTGSPSNVGVFGTKCVTASGNQPAPRFENRACWTDPNGDFWMWSGQFMTSPFSTFTPSDLWKYCVSANEWTWQGVVNSTNVTAAVWGTKYISIPSNTPDGRTGSVGWIDNSWNLYMFGGSSSGWGNTYNDLWRFTIDTACGSTCASITQTVPVPSLSSNDTTFCANDCINFTDLSTNNPTGWQWSFPGGLPSSSSAQNPTQICYLAGGSYDVSLTASNGSGSHTVTLTNYITVYPVPPTPVITCSNDTLFCSYDSTYTAYQWYNDTALVHGATHPYFVISQSGTYNVAVRNESGCSVAVGIATTGCLTGLNEIHENNEIVIAPNPASEQLYITGSAAFEKSSASIINVIGQKLMSLELNGNYSAIFNVKNLPSGVYFIEVMNQSKRWVGRFVKE